MRVAQNAAVICFLREYLVDSIPRGTFLLLGPSSYKKNEIEYVCFYAFIKIKATKGLLFSGKPCIGNKRSLDYVYDISYKHKIIVVPKVL